MPKPQDNFDPRNLVNWDDEIDPSIDITGIQALFNGYNYDERVFAEQKGGHKKSLSSF